MPSYSASDILRQDVPASPSVLSLDNTSAASDQVMFIHAVWQDATAVRSVASMSWDGVAGELVQEKDNAIANTGFSTYVVTGPATGVNNVSIAWDGGNQPDDLIVIIVIYADASQTVPVNTSSLLVDQSNGSTDSVTTDEDNCSIAFAVATQNDAGFGFGSPLIEREFQIATASNTYQTAFATENDAGTAGLKTRAVNGNDVAQLFHTALIAINPASVVGSTPITGGATNAKANPGVTAAGTIDPGATGSATAAKADPGVTAAGTIDPGATGGTTAAKAAVGVTTAGLIDPGVSGSSTAAKQAPGVSAAGTIGPGAIGGATVSAPGLTVTASGFIGDAPAPQEVARRQRGGGNSLAKLLEQGTIEAEQRRRDQQKRKQQEEEMLLQLFNKLLDDED